MTRSATCARPESLLPVIAISCAPCSRIAVAVESSSSVLPLLEIAITTSRGCTWPRLPCSVSVACRKVAGGSGRVRQPSDLFPSEAETQASEHSRQKRIPRASRIDLLDLECGHSDRGLPCGYRASFVAFGDYHRAISVAAANRFRHF